MATLKKTASKKTTTKKQTTKTKSDKVESSRKVNLHEMQDDWEKEFQYDYLPSGKRKKKKKDDDEDMDIVPEDIELDDNFDDLLGKNDDDDFEKY